MANDQEFSCEYAGGCYSTRRDLAGCEYEHCAFRKKVESDTVKATDKVD